MSASHLLGLKGPQQTPARVVEINILDDVKSIATDLSWALFFTRQQMVIKKLITPFINDSWIDKPAWERRRWNALWLHLPNGPEDLLYYITNQQAITGGQNMQHLNACEDKKLASQAFVKVFFGHQMAPESETRREPKRFPPPIHKWHVRWWSNFHSYSYSFANFYNDKTQNGKRYPFANMQIWKVFDICLLLKISLSFIVFISTTFRVHTVTKDCNKAHHRPYLCGRALSTETQPS